MSGYEWWLLAVAGVSAFATIALLGWVGLFAVLVGLVAFTIARVMAR